MSSHTAVAFSWGEHCKEVTAPHFGLQLGGFVVVSRVKSALHATPHRLAPGAYPSPSNAPQDTMLLGGVGDVRVCVLSSPELSKQPYPGKNEYFII